MTQWYYTNGRSKHGPIDEEGIRLRAQKGYVRPDTLLWHEGLQGWTPAASLGFFPEDDVEPTLCAIPVASEPPPIPRMPQPAADVRYQAPRRPIQPAAASFSIPAGRPAPEPTPVLPDEEEGETSATVASPQPPRPAQTGAFSPPPQSSAAAPAAPINVSVNATAQGGEGGAVSVSNWFWTFLAMCIPLVNVILVFVWAFGEGAPKSKQNWAKAILLWVLVGIGLTALFWGSLIGALASR